MRAKDGKLLPRRTIKSFVSNKDVSVRKPNWLSQILLHVGDDDETASSQFKGSNGSVWHLKAIACSRADMKCNEDPFAEREN